MTGRNNIKSKKITAILTILFLSFSLCGCSGKNDVSQESSSESETNEEKEAETETAKESESTEEEKKKEETTTKKTESQTEKESESQNRSSETKDNKVSENPQQSTPTQQEDEFGSDAALVDHHRSFVGVDNGHARATYTIRDGGPIYENQWVVTQEAWTENVIIGYTCTTCGISQ